MKPRTESLDDVVVKAFIAEEMIFLSPLRTSGYWPISVLECILAKLREHGQCCVQINDFDKKAEWDEVPTVAEILFRDK